MFPLRWAFRAACCLLLVAPPHALAQMQQVEPSSEVSPTLEDAVPDAEIEWLPVPPSEDVYDWIQLTSDEWLKGTIIRLRDEQFEFDSERIKERTYKWKYIKQIHSPLPRVWRFKRGIVLVGPGVLRDGRVVVTVNGVEQELKRSDLIAILPAAEGEAGRWRAKASLSAALRRGNTDQFDLSVDAWARRETARTRLRFDYDNAIGTLNGADTKNMHRGTARLDLYQTQDLFFIPGYLDAFHDSFSNIDIRLLGSTGLGYHFLRGEIDWVAFVTAGYQYQRFSSVPPGSSLDDHNGAVLAGTSFEWEVTGDLDWNTYYGVQLAFPTFGDTSHRASTVLKYELTRLLFLETGFYWDRVEKPREDAGGNTPKSDDVRLTVGFGVQY